MKRHTFIAAAPVAREDDHVKYKGLAHLSALYVPWSNGWSTMGKVFKKRKRIKPTAPSERQPPGQLCRCTGTRRGVML